MTKIIFYDMQPWERQYIEARLDGDLKFYTHSVNKDHLPEDTGAEIVSVFVDSAIDAAVLEVLPRLRLVVTRSTGYDHIDLAACQDRGVSVASVPSYGEHTVAEYAFGLILALSRKIIQGYNRVRETGSFSVEGLQGFDLKGKTIGIVGTGRIGSRMLAMAAGFGMRIVAYDPHPNSGLQKEISFDYVSLDDLLAQSDIVTLHVPYTSKTHHLINAEALHRMKEGAYLINTSRGGLVDTGALVAVLREKRLGGAGIDVLEEEGVTKDEAEFLVHGHPEEHNLAVILANHVLVDMSNVIITPHNAFNTREALERILDTTLQNIRAFLADKPINNVR